MQPLLDDIIMARSGEGTIGKVALIDNEDWEGVFADFTMRIRLEHVNPLFAYYYFRTTLFQYLVYTHKKGLGNNTNIFPGQIQEFPFLDFDMKRQAAVIQKISSQIEAQNRVQRQIQAKYQEIGKIIENAMSSVSNALDA